MDYKATEDLLEQVLAEVGELRAENARLAAAVAELSSGGEETRPSSPRLAMPSACNAARRAVRTPMFGSTSTSVGGFWPGPIGANSVALLLLFGRMR